MSQTVLRLQAASRWLQAGAVVESRREAETRDKECLGLARTLERELNALQGAMPGVSVCAAVGRSPRLRELVATYSASVHLLEQPAKFNRMPGKSLLYISVAQWVNYALSKVPAKAPPSDLQLAVAEALLRGSLLQGLSRQLASLEDTVATGAQGPAGQLVQDRTSAAALLVLLEVVAAAARTVGVLTDLGFDDTPLRHSQSCTQVSCGGVPAVGTASLAGEDAERPEVQGRRAEGQRAREEEAEERGAAPPGNNKQQPEQQLEHQPQWPQQQGQGQLHEHGDCLQPATRLTAAGLFPEVLTAMRDSSVLEHLSRGVLLLAGWLQHPKQQQQQQPELLSVFQRACGNMARLYRSLSTFTNSPDFLDGPCSVHAASGVQAAAPKDWPHCLPPLEAERHALKAAHVSLLRRILMGPCARHLVLCMGLCALAELDGGSTYGAPEAAGLRHVSVTAADKDSSGMSEVCQAAAIINLLTLLAMSLDDPRSGTGAGAGPGAGAGAGAGAGTGGSQPPGRGTCLQLTLRAARATAARGASGARVGGCDGDGQPSGYFFFTVAVQALQFAWRHMPPPQGLAQGRGWGRRGDGCWRRRAALRQWAAAAEAVARSRVATVVHGIDHDDDSSHKEVPYRLGLLLGLHPRVVGPVGRGDLPVLASGGHLLRGVETGARRFLEELDEERGVAEGGAAGAAHRDHPALGSSGPLPHAGAATAVHAYQLFALARLHPWGAGVRSRPLRDLLLQPGEDEVLPGAGQGQEEGLEQGKGQGHCREEEQGQGRGPKEAAREGWAPGPGGRCRDEGPGQADGQGEVQGQGQEEGPKEEASTGKEEGAREGGEAAQGQEGGGGEEAQTQGRGGDSLRAAASLVVALGKLLWRCEGRLVQAVGRCRDMEVGAVDTRRGDAALEVVCALCDVLLTRPDDVAFEHLGGQAMGGEDGGGAAGEGGVEDGGREMGAETRRRVWVCAFGAWRWVPALASVAQRTAAAGHVNGVSLRVWRVVLEWVGRLCLACCDMQGVAEAAAVGSAAGCGAEQLGRAAACTKVRCSCGGAEALAPGGCWRAFLLRDVGVVELLGAALCGVVPELLADDEEDDEGSCCVLAATAEACVLAAAAFPQDVAHGAWGAAAGGEAGEGRTAAGGSSNSSSARVAAIWHHKMLAALAMTVGGEREGLPLARALRALEEWAVDGGKVGGPVGFSGEQRRRLAQAVVEMCYGSGADAGEEWEQDAALLPPLCGLRALLRSCSNPRCDVLPPPGQTEAEAEVRAEAAAGAGTEVDACSGDMAAVWYCSAACREQHGLVG